MAPSSDPIIQEAAERSARVLMAKLIPELDRVRASLDRAGDDRFSQQVADLRATFSGFVDG